MTAKELKKVYGACPGGAYSSSSDKPTLVREIAAYLLPGFPYDNPDGAATPQVVPAEPVEEAVEEALGEPPLVGGHVP